MSKKEGKKAEVIAKQLKSSIVSVRGLPKEQMIIKEAKRNKKTQENPTEPNRKASKNWNHNAHGFLFGQQLQVKLESSSSRI
jgi:hypothetical protein